MIQIIKKMPTEKVYKKIIEASQELISLGLNRWETELTITDKKKKIATDVKVVIKLKIKKIKKMKTKKGAMEMSIGTIVTIVLLMSILILGIVLVKNIFEKSSYEVEYNFCYNKTIMPLYKLDLYISTGCPHCTAQKEILGPYLDEVSITNCVERGSKCIEENITGVPAWKDRETGELFVGVHTISQLAEILNESFYEWTCEETKTDVIFEEVDRDVDILITEALQIEEETGRSFKEECASYEGEFIEANFSEYWTCRLIDLVPVINQTDITKDWLSENCVCNIFSKKLPESFSNKDAIKYCQEYQCYDKFKVREVDV